MDASLTIAHGMEIFEDISPLIPENLHAPITSVVLAAGRQDKLIYTLNDRGEFSIKDYITSIRSHGATRLWASGYGIHVSHRLLQRSCGVCYDMMCQWIAECKLEV